MNLGLKDGKGTIKCNKNVFNSCWLRAAVHLNVETAIRYPFISVIAKLL